MIILSNSIAQTINPGQSATFDTIVVKTGEAECYRGPGSGSVGLRFRNSMYNIEFHGNIGASEAGAAQLAISYNDSPMLETTMISQTAAGGDLNNVGCSTAVKTMCCEGRTVTVKNTGTTAVNLGANPCFKIGRCG